MNKDLKVEDKWMRGISQVRAIQAATKRTGGMQTLFELISPQERIKIFDGGKRLKMKIACIDGRIDAVEEDCVYIRDGGLGILQTENIDVLAERHLTTAVQLGVKQIEIARHCNCGAEKISGKSNEEISKFHNSLKHVLAEKIKERRLDIEVLEISMMDINCAEGKNLDGIHDERAFYFTRDVLIFNPSKTNELPRGFVFSGEASDSRDYRILKMVVALGIAFGDQGFGEVRFLTQQPFLLIAVGKNEKEQFVAQTELIEAKQKFIKKRLAELQVLNSLSNEDVDNLLKNYDKSIVVTGFKVE